MHELMSFLVQELDLVPSTEVTLPTVLSLQTQDKSKQQKKGINVCFPAAVLVCWSSHNKISKSRWRIPGGPPPGI